VTSQVIPDGFMGGHTEQGVDELQVHCLLRFRGSFLSLRPCVSVLAVWAKKHQQQCRTAFPVENSCLYGKIHKADSPHFPSHSLM